MIQKSAEKTNRIRETLDKLYDQQPPLFREQIKRLQEDPSSRVFAPLAESYRRLGRIDEAIEICQRGLEHHPDFHSGRVALARCFLEKRRFQDAQFECEKVVQLAPENLLAQRILGEALLAQGQNKGALHAFKMALLLSPCDIGLSEKVHQLEQQSSSPISDSDEEMAIKKDDFVNIENDTFFAEQPDFQSSFPEPIEMKSNDEELKETDFLCEIEKEDESDEENASTQKVNAVLGFLDETEETFSVTSLSQVFRNQGTEEDCSEITTETLGDLYFKQGQFGHALKIFEKIEKQNSRGDLERKIKVCRVRLGVDSQTIVRKRKIKVLKDILDKVHRS